MAAGTELVEGTALHWSDILVIIVYFAFVLFIGLWVSKKVIAIFKVGLHKTCIKILWSVEKACRDQTALNWA